jgi:hypothetical protein
VFGFRLRPASVSLQVEECMVKQCDVQMKQAQGTNQVIKLKWTTDGDETLEGLTVSFSRAFLSEVVQRRAAGMKSLRYAASLSIQWGINSVHEWLCAQS